jgi:hypothetical protein
MSRAEHERRRAPVGFEERCTMIHPDFLAALAAASRTAACKAAREGEATNG